MLIFRPLGSYDDLIEIAAGQHGIVQAAAAQSAGVPASTLTRLVKSGRIQRVAQGVYRVPVIPEDRLTTYMEAVLWARGKAAISHASALELLELCDVFPQRTHLTVPPAYRRRRQGREHYEIHRESLEPEDVTSFLGVPVVTAYRAILQSARAGEDPEQLRLAVRNATSDGLLLRTEASRLRRRLR